MTLHSFIQPWLLPPGINIFLCILGFFIQFFSRLISKTILLIGFLSLWLFSTPFVAYQLIDLLQKQYPLLNLTSKPEKNSAIVILGGGNSVAPEYGNTVVLSDFTARRVDYAAYLHQQWHVPVIASGGKTFPSVPSDAKLMANTLRDRYQITTHSLEEDSINTADESKLLLPILNQHHFQTIYLVTNAWHMPRSMFIFRCRGIHAIPAPMGYFVYGPGYATISFLPNANALMASSIAMHEFIGLVWYHLKYGNMCHDNQNRELANS